MWIHKVQMFAALLEAVSGKHKRVNGLMLYSALEELRLRVLQEFKAKDYPGHDKFNSLVVMYVVEKMLPWSKFEARSKGPGHNMLHLMRFETRLRQVDVVLVTIWAQLNGVALRGSQRNRRGGGGGQGGDDVGAVPSID